MEESTLRNYEKILFYLGSYISRGQTVSTKDICIVAEDNKIEIDETLIVNIKIFLRKLHSEIMLTDDKSSKRRREMIKEILYPEQKKVTKEVIEERVEEKSIDIACKTLEEKAKSIDLSELPKTIRNISEEFDLNDDERKRLKCFAKTLDYEITEREKGDIDEILQMIKNECIYGKPSNITTSYVEKIAERFNVNSDILKKKTREHLKEWAEERKRISVF